MEKDLGKKVVLTVAGSDSIGGAGLQADIKALASLGVHCASVLTAITSQNTQSVGRIFPIPKEEITYQIDAIMEDTKVAAAKTGMLYSAEIAAAVASRLKNCDFPIIVDPVLVAGVGDRLSTEDLVHALIEEMIPLASLVTPNIPEAETITGIRISTSEDRIKVCERFVEMGAKSVLLKGGHTGREHEEEIVDTFYADGEVIKYRHPRSEHRGHGGGCILSSFIAGYLAMGMSLTESISEASRRIEDSILMNYAIGKGFRIVNAMATVEKEMEKYTVEKVLRIAIKQLESILPVSWIPEVGINFAYALPFAKEPEEVCALDGRIVAADGKPLHVGCVDFGASRHVARVVLSAMRFDPSKRSAINIRFSEEILRCFQERGLSISEFERRKEPNGRKTMEWGTEEAIRKAGFVPDVIYDRGGHGKEPMIRIIGRDPFDIIEKISKALRSGSTVVS